jgi:GTPase SAR1 family protein
MENNLENDYNNNNDEDSFDKDCPDFNYKLILIGHERVGKTSVINKFVNDKFNENEASSKTVQIQRKLSKIENTQKWA